MFIVQMNLRKKSDERFKVVIETSGHFEYITEIFEEIGANSRIALVAKREGKFNIFYIQ